MKRITCPYCHSRAYLRPGSVVYGRDTPTMLYVCSKYPTCDAYVTAHPKSLLPMGTLANKELRKKRQEAHTVLDRLWQSGLMTKPEAYRLLQVHFDIPASDAHIAKFDIGRCDELIRYCKQFYTVATTKAA